MNITFKHLKVFVKIAQTGSITAAAKKLSLSKPAISMSLADLEKGLNNQLFNRSNNRLIINDYGKKLIPLADELLARYTTIENIFNVDNTLTGKISIGSSFTIGNKLTPFLLQDFRETTGLNNQSLTVDNSSNICEKIHDFTLDIGLIEAKTQNPDIINIPWIKDKMLIGVSPHHPLAKIKKPTINDLNNEQWILREQGSGTRDYFMMHVAPQLENWTSSFEICTTEAIINCATAQLGIACLPRALMQNALNDKRLVALDIPLFHHQYWLVYHREKHLSPLLQEFLDFCKEWKSKDENP